MNLATAATRGEFSQFPSSAAAQVIFANSSLSRRVSMLQLFGSGLISLWLDMIGVQTRSPDVREIWELQSHPSLVLAPDTDPAVLNTMQQYLTELEAAGLSRASQGVWIQSGPMLIANNSGTVPLPAASLTKIATSLAALKTWTPDHQFETLISTTGPISDGVLQGDLVIQGNGDPFFVWEEAIALGNSLNQMGIKQIAGNLVISSNFAMNFNRDSLQAGELLKQGLDAASWSKAATAAYSNLPPGTLKPQVKVSGTVQVAALPIPKQILLLRHQSLPLSDILREMNIYSNNEMAEMLAQNLGGAQIVESKAVAAARVSQQEIQLVNGSGLGVHNLVSPRAAAAMLGAIQRELLPHQLNVADLFPVAGRDRRGTMEARRIPTATVVKTGTLNDVSALAGVIPTRDRGLVWFAIINRGSNIEGFRAGQDQLLQNLLRQWQVGSIPPALTPNSASYAPTPLGAASRNEVLVGG